MEDDVDPGGGDKTHDKRMDLTPNRAGMNVNKLPMSLNGGSSKEDRRFVNITYNSNDCAPYRIYCELRDNRNGTVKINKFSLGSELRKHDGFKKFITDMKYVGRHKILVFMSSYVRANTLMETINNANGPYRAYIPRHLVSVTGVVPGIPTELDIDDIKRDLECNVPIMEVKRMTKRGDDGERVPISRISVTFRSNELPEKVRFFCCVSKVIPFIPRVVLCLKCLRFGHQQDNCRGTRRCDKCTERHEDGTDSSVCQKEEVCAHCKSHGHNSRDVNCPERKRQFDIKTLMSKRNLTYTEASQHIPVISRNMYEPLNADTGEFPDLTESFASMAKGTYTWKDPMKEQWMKTNQERKAIQPAVKLYKDPPKIAKNKRPRVDQTGNQTVASATNEQRDALIAHNSSTTMNGTALSNQHHVSERERWEEMLKEAQKEAQATAKKNFARNDDQLLFRIYRNVGPTRKHKEHVQEMYGKALQTGEHRCAEQPRQQYKPLGTQKWLRRN